MLKYECLTIELYKAKRRRRKNKMQNKETHTWVHRRDRMDESFWSVRRTKGKWGKLYLTARLGAAVRCSIILNRVVGLWKFSEIVTPGFCSSDLPAKLICITSFTCHYLPPRVSHIPSPVGGKLLCMKWIVRRGMLMNACPSKDINESHSSQSFQRSLLY